VARLAGIAFFWPLTLSVVRAQIETPNPCTSPVSLRETASVGITNWEEALFSSDDFVQDGAADSDPHRHSVGSDVCTSQGAMLGHECC
jgi:hypothetical protein